MLKMICDSCGAAIDRDNVPWFGADYSEPPKPIDVADDEMVGELLTEVRLSSDHEFHFCSSSCLSAWAFSRELSKDD